VEDHALDLKSAHASLRVEHHESDLKPIFKGYFVFSKIVPLDDAEAIFFGALMALPVIGFVLERVDLFVAATRTFDTIRPAMLNQKIAASIFGFEHRHQLAEVYILGGF
jgi:hypothetical protein